jgi:hypothetical protein
MRNVQLQDINLSLLGVIIELKYRIIEVSKYKCEYLCI